MKNMSTRCYPAITTRLPRGSVQRTLQSPKGLYHKNGLFWIDGTECYYNGEAISGMTVTDGDKQIVGMGAYICVFPDKLIYNSATGEVISVDSTYTQSGTITFEELSTDSVFCKITAAGIESAFKKGDGVKFLGVNDDVFLVDGEGATKVITEIGTDYIVVSAVIQNARSGTITMLASGNSTRVEADGINDTFAVNDHVKVIGCADELLNMQDKIVTSKGTGYIILNAAFPAKTYTQSQTMSYSPYYVGASQTRLVAEDLGSTFSAGDVVTISGCSNSALNGSKKIVQAGTNYIVIEGTTSAESTQASGVTITRTSFTQSGVTVKRTSFTRASGITLERKSQDFDFVCEHDNRLWGCSSANHEIYASKLGDPTNWSCYENASTDSYTLSVGSDGDFTACCSHMGYVLFFKEQSISMMYGNKPSNYQLNYKQMPGVRAGCDRSICIVDETLFYVGRNGVYQFDGAIPQKISDQIKSELTEAVASQQDAKYYLSCLKDGKQAVLVYDPALRVWMREDDERFQYATYGDGILYYIDGENNLKTITGDGNPMFNWSVESGDLRESSINEKWISKAKFNMWLDVGSEANVFFRFDEDPLWHRAGTIHSVVAKTYTIPIVPQRCSRFRWKIEGRGNMKLLAMGISVEGGSEINGSIQSWLRH